jgi:hypothetical protein
VLLVLLVSFTISVLTYGTYLLNLTILKLDSKQFTMQENPWLDPVLERRLFLAQKVCIHFKISANNYLPYYRVNPNRGANSERNFFFPRKVAPFVSVRI